MRLGASRCDPFDQGLTVFVVRYYLALARRVLEGLPIERYGICEVVKTKTGWDGTRWRRPAVFTGVADAGDRCDVRSTDSPASDVLLPDLVPCRVSV